MSKSNGKIWPYAISASIILVFGACVATVIVTSKLPVQNSDTYMMGYHEADAKANELIKSKIEFDKKYKIEYITDAISKDNCAIKYKVTDVNLNPVNDAKIKVIVTRPDSRDYDHELSNSKVENGVYSFEPITLPKEGRWNVMAKVSIDDSYRFYNVKTDTRSKEVKEY